MTKVAVLIPFESREEHRERNLRFICRWYRERFPDWCIYVAGMRSEEAPRGYREGWIKAIAVQNCIKAMEADNFDADVFVIADADCIVESVGKAVEAVSVAHYKWSIPHAVTRRLKPAPTSDVIKGTEPHGDMPRSGRGYPSVHGGGVTVLRAEVYRDCPLDPRFHVTHGEDISWGRALYFLHGKPWQAETPLYHLWHPPIPAMGDRYQANRELAKAYKRAKPRELRRLVDQAKEWRPTPMPAPLNSDAELAIIVPVMKRPKNASTFMESLKRHTDMDKVRVYAIADFADDATISAWEQMGAYVILADRGETFAAKVNQGYEITCEPWLLFVGDDVIFHAGWHEAATATAGDGYSVIAINDGTRDDLDELATHAMMRRSYIDDVGASLEGPGTVAWQGYHHWCPDLEWSLLARDRGVYAAAHDSHVEHMHPNFGKADEDEVYKKGQATSRWDRRNWALRKQDYVRKRGKRA